MHTVQLVKTARKIYDVASPQVQTSAEVVQRDMQAAMDEAALRAVQYLSALLEDPELRVRDKIAVARILLREGALYKVALMRTGSATDVLY